MTFITAVALSTNNVAHNFRINEDLLYLAVERLDVSMWAAGLHSEWEAGPSEKTHLRC